MTDYDLIALSMLFLLCVALGSLLQASIFGSFNEGYSTAVCESKNMTWNIMDSEGIKKISCSERISDSCERFDGTNNYVCINNKKV